MSITSELIRGHTDAIILANLCRQDSYGYQINKDIMLATGGGYEMKEATLYTAFRRLEAMGFICSYWGDQESGARRRYYSITTAGKTAYTTHIKEWQHSKIILDTLLANATNTQAAQSKIKGEI